MTTKDAIKYLSDKIDYAEQCDDKWVDSVSIKALYIAVRAMANERQKGEWIVYEGEMTCSCCETTFYADICEYIDGNAPKFCPWCGARMEDYDNGTK